MELWDNIFSLNEDRNFGFVNENKKIKFLIPEQLIPPNKDDNYLFLKRYNSILHKYSNSKLSESLLKSDISNEKIRDMNLEVISSYLAILEDYLFNDTFYLFEKFYKTGEKKINWNKTLKENEIIISGNNIVYSNFITKNKNINKHSQYYLLYLEALRQAKHLFLGINEEEGYFTKNKNEQKYHIYKYIEEHFKDRELLIAKNLNTIFLNDNWASINEKTFDFKYYVKFENIWEDMIHQMLGGYIENIKFKDGKYKISQNMGIRLLPDHFINYNNNYYLLDSKFYKSYLDKSYPDSGDIVKQVMYKLLIARQKNINPDDILNIFIFPKNNPKNIEPEIFDLHSVDDNSDFNIYCIALDIQTIMDLYLKESSYPILLDYLESIKDKDLSSLFNKTKVRKTNNKTVEIIGYIINKYGVKNEVQVISENKKIKVLKGSYGFFVKDKILYSKIDDEQKKLLDKGIIKEKSKNVFIFETECIFKDYKSAGHLISGDEDDKVWDKISTRKRAKISQI